MTSRRLPGKVLREVAGQPVLGYVLERLERCDGLDAILVATSNDESDTPVADYGRRRGTACFRGSLDDVAGRFCRAAATVQASAFIRVTGDSPLLDQRLIRRGLDLFREGLWELVTNVAPRSFPKGQSVEVLDTSTFVSAHQRIVDADDREYVTRYFYRNAGAFRIRNFAANTDLSDIQLSIDTAEDLDMFATLVARMTRPHWQYGLHEILGLRNTVGA